MYFCSKEQISKQNKAEHCKQNGYQIVTQKSTNRTEYSYIKGRVTFLSKVSEKYCNKCGFIFLFCNVKHVLSLRCTVEGGVELSKECHCLTPVGAFYPISATRVK